MLAITVNTLNEKGQKYKLSQDKGVFSIIFGIIANGKKEKVEIVPVESEIIVKLLDTEKRLDEAGFGTFIGSVLELKALQEKESKLIEALKA
jgi:hypothetical protein